MFNGESHTNREQCKVAREWDEYRKKTEEVMEQVDDIHAVLPQLVQTASYLNQLAVIATTLTNLSTAMIDVKDRLLEPAINIDRMPLKTVHLIVRILGVVIIGLIAVLAFLLTGENFQWIKGLHR